MNALLLFSIGVAITGQAELPDWPPLPEEEEHVDYIKWYDDARRAGMKPGDDAFPLYREIMPTIDDPDATWPERSRFSGFRTNVFGTPKGYPKPWKPKNHPNWEESYQRTRETLEILKRAAALPYFCEPERFTRSGPDSLLISFKSPIVKQLRPFAKGLSEAAWRAPSGRVDVSGFMEYVHTALQIARQVERDPKLISRLYAVAIRAMVYDDIRLGVDRRVFGGRDLGRLSDELNRIDTDIPSLDAAMRFECAVALDVLQYCFEQEPVGEAENLNEVRHAIRDGELDRQLGADEIVICYKTLADALATMGRRRSRELLVSMKVAEESFESNAVLRIVSASYVRTSDLRDRGASSRSATHLIVAMHIFRDQHGRWPNTLDELPADVISQFKIDAVSKKPFVYRLEYGRPLLYSLGANAIDDGGCHDPHYGDRAPKSDFVYWPANGGCREPMIRTSRWPRS